MTRQAWAAVDLAAVAANARGIRRMCPGANLIAVVKRDAYGHGAPAVARALRGIAGLFAVADAGEAEALRRSGIRAPILLLNPAADAGRAALARLRLMPSLTCGRDLDAVPAPRAGLLAAHIKFDTGMGRLGFDFRRAGPVAALLRRRGVRRLGGAYTHLSAADEMAFTRAQLGRFDACLAVLRAAGIDPGLTHAANSCGVLTVPAARRYGAVRPGLLLYGCAPGGARLPAWARPAMSFRTRVAAVRPVARGTTVSYMHRWRAPRQSILAVLPVGYADGYSRAQSCRGVVLVRGRLAPVRGIVCMNHTVVDATRIPGIRTGDEAVLFGAQRGRTITAGEVAKRQGTISYEILLTAGGLNRRVYL